jgi:hypothetical protein
MHEEHPVFEPPSNPDIAIWRYMDLAKFLSMLQDQALHFARVDIMPDEFEGSISKPTLDHQRKIFDMPGEAFERFSGQLSEANRLHRAYTYLSCWHMNEHESAAMWAIYQSGEPRGVAVRSTYRGLSGCITDQRSVYIGTVNYIDFDTEIVPDGNGYYPYVHKRKSFEHEREIRAVCPGDRFRRHGDAVEELPIGSPVIPIAVDLDGLVQAVYVSPKAPEWFAELVPSLLSRYGRNWPVHHSSLDADPLY